MDNGFAIRCPHCQKWSQWSNHPEEKVVHDDEFTQILDGLKECSVDRYNKVFTHEKLLRCQSLSTFCPASFEAIICQIDDLYPYSNKIESWSFKRHFRLFKNDMKNRWDDQREGKYCCLIFNSLPVIRPRYIELESLMDRELVSRLIAGMCVEIDAPLTFFALNVFQLKEGSDEVTFHWMPIEGYSKKQKLSPPLFNPFCEICRNITMNKLIEEFKHKKPIDKCPHLKNDKCENKEGKAPCKMVPIDYNHCPVFADMRKEQCPCYHSDITIIEDLEKKWNEGKKFNTIKQEEYYRCHAGFYEYAFPIEVHKHLIGIAMTGQVFFNYNEIKRADQFIYSKSIGALKGLPWNILDGEEEKLENARYILIGHELKPNNGVKARFLINTEELNKRIERLLPNIDRFRESAESHYRDYRNKLEAAFRSELLGFIENHRKDPFFFDEHIKYLLSRMREFWAFKEIHFLRYSFQKKTISKIGWSIAGNAKSYGIDGKCIYKLEIDDRDIHSCPYFHHRGEIPLQESRIDRFLPAIEKIIDHDSLSVGEHIEKGDCEFMVLVPTYKEVYFFVFVARDPQVVSTLLSVRPNNISELCQDAIFETCNEIVGKFHSIEVFCNRQILFLVKEIVNSYTEMIDSIDKLNVRIDTIQLSEDHKRFLHGGLDNLKGVANKIKSEIEQRYS